MTNISQKLLDVIEDQDWNVDDYEDGSIDLESYSNMGEDFIVSFSAEETKDDETFIQALFVYTEEFDPEEHAAGWYQQHNGEPSSLRTLLEDADYIKKEMLEPLYKALVKASKGKAEPERVFDPDNRDEIQRYYEENYTMDRAYAVHLTSNVIDYAFSMIEDREERMDFLDYVLEDFRKNAGEEL